MPTTTMLVTKFPPILCPTLAPTAPPHIMSSMMNSIYIPTVQLQEKPAAGFPAEQPFPELQKAYPDHMEKQNNPDAGEKLTNQSSRPKIPFSFALFV